MGTVAYCAPEQIAHGSADPRSDVYSAGVVLFELLTGAAPYRGESAMNVAYQHVHSRVPAPSSRVRRHVPVRDRRARDRRHRQRPDRPSGRRRRVPRRDRRRPHRSWGCRCGRCPPARAPARPAESPAPILDGRRTPSRRRTDHRRHPGRRRSAGHGARPAPRRATDAAPTRNGRGGVGAAGASIPPPVVIPPPNERAAGKQAAQPAPGDHRRRRPAARRGSGRLHELVLRLRALLEGADPARSQPVRRGQQSSRTPGIG